MTASGVDDQIKNVPSVDRSGPRLSVLMVSYAGDAPYALDIALESLAIQSHPADEIVLVRNGDLNDAHDKVIAHWSTRLPMNTPALAEPTDLATALNEGLAHCAGEFVARMDSDDVCHPVRFERQLSYLCAHPRVDVLGTAIDEFENDPSRPVRTRAVPLSHDGIVRRALWRNPMNHMTVMFRRDRIKAVGGYSVLSGFEDYELWVRLLASGTGMVNLADSLVFARIGNGFLARRSGPRYAMAEWQAMARIRRAGLYHPWLVGASMPARFLLRCAPSALVQAAYRLVRRRPSGPA